MDHKKVSWAQDGDEPAIVSALFMPPASQCWPAPFNFRANCLSLCCILWSPIQVTTGLIVPLYREWKYYGQVEIRPEVLTHSWVRWVRSTFQRNKEKAAHLLLRRSRAAWELRGNSCCSIHGGWKSPLCVSRVTCADSSWCLSLAGAAVTWKGDRSQKHQHLCVKKPSSFPSSDLWCLTEKFKWFTGGKPLN